MRQKRDRICWRLDFGFRLPPREVGLKMPLTHAKPALGAVGLAHLDGLGLLVSYYHVSSWHSISSLTPYMSSTASVCYLSVPISRTTQSQPATTHHTRAAEPLMQRRRAMRISD